LLISSIGILRGKTQALVAGIVVLATSSFIQLGAMQYADVPMSFYILATLALLCLQDRFPGDLRFSIAAGLTAGFAPWTKNEGWLFLAAVLLARLIAMLRFETRTVLGPQVLRFAAAALPSVALTAFFKLRFAPPNDLFGQKASDLVAHVAVFGRWIITLEGFVKILFLIGGFLLPIVLILGLYWFLVRFHVEERERTSLATVLLAIGLMLAGEFVIYVVFPPDIVTQLNVSLERLCMQLWPAALLAIFLAANPPQLVTLRPVKPKHDVKAQKPKPRAQPPKPAHPPVRLN
jgi:4-amino-4-deoxy-L-arabinose transferase-like glycosyltransferase